MRIAKVPGRGYELQYAWKVDSPAGFAGNLVSDGRHAYWLDTAGALLGAQLGEGKLPKQWPTQRIHLPSLLGVHSAFTNTEPAVVKTDNGTELYITLRNYQAVGTPPLRGDDDRSNPHYDKDYTGSHGAVLAIDTTGKLKWKYLLTDAHSDKYGRTASMNTAPLVIEHSKVVLVGDVNGYLYSFAMDSGAGGQGVIQPFLHPAGGAKPLDRYLLLNNGREPPLPAGEELPARGPFNFSQVSGVGVDPIMVGGLIMVGVNFDAKDEIASGSFETQGRLVAFRLRQAYNLGWIPPDTAQPRLLRAGFEQKVSAPVLLTLFPRVTPGSAGHPTYSAKTLGELCGEVPQVQWYVTGPDGYVRRLPATSELPAGLANGAQVELTVPVTLQPADPAEGAIVGVIDHPAIMALAGQHPASEAVKAMLTLGTKAGVEATITCRQGSEIIQLPSAKAVPQSGLADNLLRIPYKKGNPQLDCQVTGMTLPGQPLTQRPFGVQPKFRYTTNVGANQVEAQIRIWARSDPDGEAPDAWFPLSLTSGASPPPVQADFDVLPIGTWEIVAEIWCEGDTNRANNIMVKELIMVTPGRNKLPSYGSVLTN